MAGETSQAFSSGRGECLLLTNNSEDSEIESLGNGERTDRPENECQVVRNLTQKKGNTAKSADRNRSSASAKIRDMESESDSDTSGRSRKRKRSKKLKKDKKHKRRKRRDSSESVERVHVSPLRKTPPLLSDLEDHHEDEYEDDFDEIEREYLKDEEKGPEVREKMASFIRTVCQNRMTDEKLQQKLDKYKIPSNCTLTVPRVNSELWSKMEKESKQEDFALQKAQRQMIKSTVALMRACDRLVENEAKSKNIKEILQMLTDAIGLNMRTVSDLNRDRRQQVVNAQRLEKQMLSEDYEVSGNLWNNMHEVLRDVGSNSRLSRLLKMPRRGRRPRFYSQGPKNQWQYQSQRDYGPYQYQRGAVNLYTRGLRGRSRGRARGWTQPSSTVTQ
jgi:hypothetical protein